MQKTSMDYKKINEDRQKIQYGIIHLPSDIPREINNPNWRSTGRFPANLPRGVNVPKPVSSVVIPS